MAQLFNPLLTLTYLATVSLLAKYVLYLTKENRILRERIPGEIHTKAHEHAQRLKYGKPLRNVINELTTIVTPSTFHHWVREEKRSPKKGPVGHVRVPCCVS